LSDGETVIPLAMELEQLVNEMSVEVSAGTDGSYRRSAIVYNHWRCPETVHADV
jgi:hypothetical protein